MDIRMQTASLLRALKEGFEDLSPQLRAAARWVIDNPDEVALLTAREQARRARVTPATLTRLAQHFGLSGYEDVRRLHAEDVRRHPRSYRGRAEELLHRRDTEGDAALVQDIFSSLAHHLHALTAPDAVRRFTAAAERIARGQRVFCFGARSTYSVAQIFHYLRTLFGDASVMVDGPGGTGIDALRAIGPKDVLLAVTMSPYARETAKAAKFAASRGAAVIAITDSEVSPLASVATETLIVHTETPSFFDTMAPAFAAMECLAALVAARRGPRTLAALAASEKQLADFDTYVLPLQKKRNRP
jgi:DNA-binding MurR/RpiR family transcriptional regulator